MRKTLIPFITLMIPAAVGLVFFSQSKTIDIIPPLANLTASSTLVTSTQPTPPKEETLEDWITAAKKLPPIIPPEKINAIYVTAPTASSASRVEELINFAKNSDINAMVINVKDSDATYITGWMARLARRLRQEGIYPIARIVLFQDNNLAQTRPDLALKTSTGALWGKKGYQWVDPASSEVHDHIIKISRQTLDIGFAELNFDYVRFPDGNIDEIVYPIYNYEKQLKKTVINQATAYINSQIKETNPDAIISLDIFGYALLRDNDLGIGQKFTDLVDNFDVIAPMIYPSHYAAGNFGFPNPATEPYQVMTQTIEYGNHQLVAANKTTILRPWIQDFNMGAVYDREKIIAQIRGIEDATQSGNTIVLAATSSSTSTPKNATSPVGAPRLYGVIPDSLNVIPDSDRESNSTTNYQNRCNQKVVCNGGWMAWNPSNRYSPDKYQNTKDNPQITPSTIVIPVPEKSENTGI